MKVKSLRIFDPSNKMPQFILKHQNIYEIILALYCCIVVPTLCAVISTRGEDRAIYKSLSYLAYTEGHMAIVLILGLAFLIGYFFALTFVLFNGGFTKIWKILFYSLAIISSIVLIGGISVPWLHIEGEKAEYYNKLRQIHNNLATAGFVLLIVTTILLFLSTFFRNIKHGLFSLAAIGYFFVTAFYAMKEANIIPGPCKVSSVAQIYIFSALSFIMFLQYLFTRFIPIKTNLVKEN